MTNEEALEIVKDIQISTWLKSYKDAAEKAADALELQIPKKVRRQFGGYVYCPMCDVTEISDEYDYCPYCGQALDWSNEDDE